MPTVLKLTSHPEYIRHYDIWIERGRPKNFHSVYMEDYGLTFSIATELGIPVHLGVKPWVYASDVFEATITNCSKIA